MALLAGGIVLATGGGTPTAEPSTTPAPAESPAPTPTPTLPADQQQAVDESAAVVLAYEQTVYDLLADPAADINDLYGVLTDPQIDTELGNIQQLRAAGTITVESTGPVALGPVAPVEVDLGADPPTVTLLVCVDRTAARGTEDGQPWTGRREASQYRVVRTTYLPAPGWAVAQVQPPAGLDQPQPC